MDSLPIVGDIVSGRTSALSKRTFFGGTNFMSLKIVVAGEEKWQTS
jgi:hypothetical protein